MKKSFLFSVIILAAVPVYMGFIIRQSPKNYPKTHARYLYPAINEFNAEAFITVWEKASDTIYMECIGCDTTGIYQSGTLSMNSRNHYTKVMEEVGFHKHTVNVDYKLGLRSLYRVAANNNNHYITGFRQSKMEININMAGKAYLEDCELDTLIVNCEHGPFDKELVIGYNSYIKHILLDGRNPSGEVASEIRLTCVGSRVDNLKATNVFENTFNLDLPSHILSYMSFTLNGKQVTEASR